MARVYPSGEENREDRHGLWRGITGDQIVWEVRYTRGNPTGPYREWGPDGELFATWPYNWDGELEGWARWFRNGEPIFKREMSPEDVLPFDPVGDATRFLQWAEHQE